MDSIEYHCPLHGVIARHGVDTPRELGVCHRFGNSGTPCGLPLMAIPANHRDPSPLREAANSN